MCRIRPKEETRSQIIGGCPPVSFDQKQKTHRRDVLGRGKSSEVEKKHHRRTLIEKCVVLD